MKFTQVPLGPHTVDVIAGGYYDRYRMNPDLDEVAREAGIGNVDWFRRFPKRMADSGLGSMWTPNYYYRSSSLQLVFLAPLSRLRPALPVPLEPISPVPGYGMVALSFFSYPICDNDAYNEAAVAIAIRRPGSTGPHALELARSLRRRVNYAHVLALPVTTELARMRGLLGYQLPKWAARIDLDLSAEAQAQVANLKGEVDLRVSAPMPVLSTAPSQSHLSTVTMVNRVDGRWSQSTVQANNLSFAQRFFPQGVKVERHGGPMSDLLDGLGISRLIRMEVIKEAQLVLHLPVALD